MIKGTMEKHTISWLRRMSTEKLLDFTISIQRKEVWDLRHKSNLIAAVLRGIPIESVLFEEEAEGDGFLVIDGKQRNLAFLAYIRDEFAISDDVKIEEINGENIVGKKFSELSSSLQEKILEYELPIQVMRPMTEDEREEVFYMRNQAVPLTKFELVRVALGDVLMATIEGFAAHAFMEKTNVSKTRYQDQQVILECLMLDAGMDYGFSGNDLMTFAAILRDQGISDESQVTFAEVLDYLNEAVKVPKKQLRKVHIPTIFMVAKVAMKDELPSDEFGKWLTKFFTDIKGDENEYAKATDSGVNQKQNIRKRLEYARNHYHASTKPF